MKIFFAVSKPFHSYAQGGPD